MPLEDFLSMGAWMRRSLRLDDAVVRWLHLYPGTCDVEIADGLRRSTRAVHRRLLRLEREGRVTTQWARTDFFDFVVYYPAPHTGPNGG